jgi:DNA polymerase-3 subunit alpha
LESLAYAGAFDCFADIHRAQYFFTPNGDTSTGLEKIIRFGHQYQAQLISSSNTLFGNLQMTEVTPPNLPDCAPWPLIQLLDFEKDVTGMFMSGHPLDNFKFEIKYYGLTPITEFNEFKEAIHMHPNPGRQFRIAGLVANAQHKISKNGNKYGNFFIEDYTGRMELTLWGDDYVKFNNYLEAGMVIFITGWFRQRYAGSPFEFKVTTITLLETMKKICTKKLSIDAHPKYITKDVILFFEKNIKSFPGNSTFKFCLSDQASRLKVGMYSIENGFEMNDEMAQFLQQKPELEVQVELT